MIYCVCFADVEAYLHDLGFGLSGEIEAHFLYRRSSGSMTIHKPNEHGDITEIEMNGAFDAAGINPPKLTPHWCD